MSRHASFTAVALAVLALALGDVPAGGHAATAAANGSAELVECKRGKQAKDRLAVFRGEMRQVADDLRMQMRFQLAEKVGKGPWTALSAPGIGVWREARAGIKLFAYRQRVVALRKGSSYRASVEFRWLAADGSVTHRERARSRACRQPGKLPNLKIAGPIAAKPGPTEDTLRYAVRVGNSGLVTANRVELELLVDGAEVDTKVVGRLAPGARRTVHFVGPACSGQVTAQIDPGDLTPEITERDNVVRTPCSAVL